MNNETFMDTFISTPNFCGAYAHLMAKGGELVNYSTTICVIDHERKTARVNVRKYSTTTSKIQGKLLYLLAVNGYTVEEYNGEPAYMWNCGYMGAPTLTKADTANI